MLIMNTSIISSEFYLHSLLILQKGMDLPHISNSEILSPIIPLPDLVEHRKIVSILSSTDTAIQNQQAYKLKIENLKRGLMQRLLTGKIRVKV
jgi:type I restriction enzyme, S subunit